MIWYLAVGAIIKTASLACRVKSARCQMQPLQESLRLLMIVGGAKRASERAKCLQIIMNVVVVVVVVVM